MKELKISMLLFLSCLGSTYAQDLPKNQKVESPFRLMKGGVLKTNTAMTFVMPNKVVRLYEVNGKATEFRNTHKIANRKRGSETFFPLVSSPENQHMIENGVIVIDGAVVDQN